MKFDLTPLLAKQKALDEEIARRHEVTYASTLSRRFLALYVELGELANATRCFKYWSLKKSEPRAVVLDEYADGLHFLLSLAVMLDFSHCSYEGEGFQPYFDLTDGFLSVYALYEDLRKNFDKKHWIEAMEGYVRLLLTMGYDIEEAFEAYDAKMAVNLHRQESGY